MKIILKTLKWMMYTVFSLLVLVIGVGSIYQYFAQKSDLKEFPPSGQMVDVGGNQIHVQCLGQGSPTVIVEQGLGAASATWEVIHQEVAAFTRICAYDRPGFGYSKPVAEPQSSAQVAQRLNQLLETVGINEEIVLVGWSAGGVYIREFYRQFPENVRGMVFVDSSHEQQSQRLPQQESSSAQQAFVSLMPLLGQVGVLRMTGMVKQQVDAAPVPDELKPRLLAIYNQSHTLGAMAQASKGFSADLDSALAPTSLGDLPLIVLTQGIPVDEMEGLPPSVDRDTLREGRKKWNVLQQELTALSSRSKQIIAHKSGHAIHAGQPELLVQSIAEMVDLTRGVIESFADKVSE